MSGYEPEPLNRGFSKVPMIACGVCTGVVIIVIAAMQYVSYSMIAMAFVEAHTRWAPPLDLTPGTAMSYVQSWECEYLVNQSKEVLGKLEAFNNETGWKRVSLMSRPADSVVDAKLDAWYLESPKGTKNSPTIVVQHGNNVNNNDHTVEVVGAMLRELGYNVLLPSLRNHGDSQQTGVLTWAASEAYDLLGAWDYVVADPDGKLGGSKKPSEVALLGFSMGGYIAQVAFGLEPRIPGLFLDSAVFDAYTELEFNVKNVVGSVGATILMPSAWFWTKHLAGADLGRLTPAKVLKKRGDNRKIALVHGSDDVTVPFTEEEAREAFMKTTDYEVVDTWHPHTVPEAMSDGCSPHCELHLTYPYKYSAFACRFYAKVFNENVKDCSSESISSSPPKGNKTEKKEEQEGTHSERRLFEAKYLI
eukprot:TRINITY_DN5280_c0_g1_i3.p1 TRINITY_DN5280_c0_g1~~TRINITY_DN5280_c0_g1_i3.p1  ORF type:complete len:418 (-),score=61.17 TRINITY_DN5280_c0_g1_i3:482-1735(-)